MNIEDCIHQPTDEMNTLFITRSNVHRFLVKGNLLLMENYRGLSFNILSELAEQHDLIKFKEPECIAYTWMTWMYYCKNNGIVFDCPQSLAKIISQGWHHHIRSNLHHPEAHPNPDLMNISDIVEMVCDWAAIAQENNDNNGSCLQWATLNIYKKWNFSLEKNILIFSTIQELDRRRGIL